MKKGKARVFWKIFSVAYFIIFLDLFLTIPASAYVDPATTAMIAQIVAGIFISIGLAFGIFRQKIYLFFKNMSVKRTKRKLEKQSRNGNS